MVTRRTVLMSAAAIGALTVARAGAAGSYEVAYSDAEWRRRLSPQQYAVLRQADTERPHSSPLNGEHRKGRFSCAGCGAALFSSDTKFESGTGWPSFWAPLDKAVGQGRDTSLGMEREEVHCARCGGHLGHVSTTGRSRPGFATA